MKYISEAVQIMCIAARYVTTINGQAEAENKTREQKLV
jgi:hypothetical protein